MGNFIRKLVLNKSEEAFEIYRVSLQNNWYGNDLLKELVDLIFKSLKLKDEEIFKQLMESFKNTINRDKDIFKAIRKIGKGYLNINFNETGGIFDMLEGISS